MGCIAPHGNAAVGFWEQASVEEAQAGCNLNLGFQGLIVGLPWGLVSGRCFIPTSAPHGKDRVGEDSF